MAGHDEHEDREDHEGHMRQIFFVLLVSFVLIVKDPVGVRSYSLMRHDPSATPAT